MGGSLHFDTAASHDASYLHCLNGDFGATGWYGRSLNPGFPTVCVHCGHAHLDMNSYYNVALPLPSNKQQIACHEIGHPVGLAHSSDATDCMVDPYTGGQPTIGFAHRDQLRNQYTATGH